MRITCGGSSHSSWEGGEVESVDEHSCELVKPPYVFDAGTPNIPGIIGLGQAPDYVLEIGIERIAERERKLTEQMMEIADLKRVEVYGPRELERREGIVSFNVRGLGSLRTSRCWSMLDELAKIAVRSGHHCAAHDAHLGVEGTVRASVHYYKFGRRDRELQGNACSNRAGFWG